LQRERGLWIGTEKRFYRVDAKDILADIAGVNPGGCVAGTRSGPLH